MPEISRFHGIVIGMFYREHGTAHFHAVYGGERASIDIGTCAIRGHLPNAVERLVLEWTRLHRAELLVNWERARQGEPLVPIAPLE
jgi:Domain of unknown function (DUF4160)